MPENTAPATSQPAPQAQNDARPNGPENVDGSAYARQFLKKPAPVETPAPEITPTAETPVSPVETPATETHPQVTETPTEQHEEAEEALSQSTSLSPEQQEAINKRIGKITAKRKEAERRAEAAEQALAQLARAKQEQPPVEPPVQSEIPNQPLAKIRTVEELQKLHKDATEAVRFAEYNLDREDVVEQQGQKGVLVDGQFFSKEQLRTIKYNAKATAETEIPQRAQFLNAQQQAYNKAVELYPWMKDQTTPEYQTAIQAIREQPWLNNLPNAALAIGRFVEGLKVEQTRSQPKPPPPKIQPRPRPSGDQTAVSSDASAGRAPLGSQVRQQMQAEDAKLATKGSVSAKEFAESLTRKAQLRKLS